MFIRAATHAVLRRFAGALVVVGLLSIAGAAPAAAQSRPAPTATDRVDLVGLTTRQPAPDAPSNQVEFQATVNYRLQSASNGFVVLFLFENSANDSSQQSSEKIAVERGTGQLVLNIDYALVRDVRTLTLVAGLFRSEQTLLAWVSTNPIDMAPWPGRVAFEKAMAARLADDLTAAEQNLTGAIQDSPDTGNYYYWRGDTRVRMNKFADAVVDFDRSIELMPQDRPSRVGRGLAHLWLGQAEAAISDLSYAIEASNTPDRATAWAYRARGLAHARLGEPQDAVADYKAYLDLSPDAADRAQIERWIADLTG
jgi:tetratricopeptide (TPR) repeat protein